MSTYQYGENIHANGIRQHYLRYGGKGPVVVLLPGITSPAPTWSFVAEELGRDMDVYVIDIRGRGLTETPEDQDYSLDAYAKDIGELARVLKLQGYFVLGHSMGARIGMRLASHAIYGSHIERLLLADPPVSGPGKRPYPTPLNWYIDSLHLSVKGCSGEDLRSYSPTWTNEHLRIRAEWLPTCDETAIRETHRFFHEESILDDLPNIRANVLLMAAGKGGVIEPSDIAELTAQNPDMKTVIMESAGHMIPWDDLDGFITETRRFFG